MALKTYELNGLTFQFEEGKQPAGAVEVKQAAKKEDKQTRPADKERRAEGK